MVVPQNIITIDSLNIPAFSASLIVNGLVHQMLIGWLLSIIGCIIGLSFAYQFDLPVGATIVSILGLLPIVSALYAKYSR